MVRKEIAVWFAVLVFPSLAAWAAGPQPAVLTGLQARGAGPFEHEAGLLTDGKMVEPGTHWQDPGCVFWGDGGTHFVIDLGGPRQVYDVLLQVDNNDDYFVECSADGAAYRPLFTVGEVLGEVSSGMDTFSTRKGDASYAPQADFQPVVARYLKLYAAGGDEHYAAAEVKVMAAAGEKPPPAPQPVPEPKLAPSPAPQPPPSRPTVKGSGPFSRDARLLVDGRIPQQGSAWDGEGCVFWAEEGVFFVVDLGSQRTVRDLLIQVDNNDTYHVEYSADGTTWKRLATVSEDAGTVPNGMDTFCSSPKHAEHEPTVAFQPVQARYLKLYAAGGDGSYSASEIEVR